MDLFVSWKRGEKIIASWGQSTNLSLKFFEKHRHELGKVSSVYVNGDDNEQFGMQIRGKKGIMLLSGVNCGYIGQGPSGSIKILRMLGFNGDTIKEQIETKNHLIIRNS